MKEAAIEALKEINERLKTNKIDGKHLLRGHRIDHNMDIEQNEEIRIILGEEVTDRIFEFARKSNFDDFIEYGTYFFGRMLGDYVYISKYTQTDFENFDTKYIGGSVCATEQNMYELKQMTDRKNFVSKPYNVVVHFHTHPDHFIDKNGKIITPASNYYSENDLYSYGYQQVYLQQNDNHILYIGCLLSNNKGFPIISFVIYDEDKKNFINIKNAYYILDGELCKFIDGEIINQTLVDKNEKIKLIDGFKKIS